MASLAPTKPVNLLSSQILITTSTSKGVKTYSIHGHEFDGIVEETTLSGRIIKRAKIGATWKIGTTQDPKKARAYVKSCKAMGYIVTIDLPESARGI